MASLNPGPVTHLALTTAPAPPKSYLSLREAMARLAYTSAYTFREHANRGWISGAEKRGSGPGRPGGRWVFRAADLAYVGPLYVPTSTIESERSAAAAAKAALEEALDHWTPTFSRSRKRSHAAA